MKDSHVGWPDWLPVIEAYQGVVPPEDRKSG